MQIDTAKHARCLLQFEFYNDEAAALPQDYLHCRMAATSSQEFIYDSDKEISTKSQSMLNGMGADTYKRT